MYLPVCSAWQTKPAAQPAAAAAQTPVTAGQGSSAGSAPKTVPSAGANTVPTPADPNKDKQSASQQALLTSVDNQKAAIRAQAGAAASSGTDSFFTTSWSSPATIPIPDVVPTCSAMPEADLKLLVDDSAKTEGLKPELIRAVIRRESASYPCALSDKGATGLMQLMPDIAQQFNVDPFDPKQNVQGGSRYLKQLMTRYKGDLKLALAAYNAGPQRVDAGNKVPDIPETTSYVDAILKDLSTNGSSHP